MSVYPCYVDFDRFIDVERLRELHDFIAGRIGEHIAAEKDSFFLNQHRLDDSSPYVPGVREIWLSQTAPGTPYDYLDLDKPELWQPSEAAAEFAPLMEFIASLPFSRTGRMLIIYDDAGNAVPAHRDHVEPDICHEFIWMRTRFNKRFFLLNPATGERSYVASHSAWFDSVNQYHGADGSDGLSFSIRVDGRFNDAFRSQIPFDDAPRSAAPARWAAMLGGDASEPAAAAEPNERLMMLSRS